MRAAAHISTAEDAISNIPDGATVAVGGFVGAGHPELLTATLEKRFLETGTPQNLTLVYAAGQGDREHCGLNHLAHESLLKRVIGGHWNLAPKLGQLALEEKIEAWNFPQGVVSVLFREIAAKRPGVITKVGLDTFIDPAQTGGQLNECSRDDLIERITIDDEIWLRYKSFPIHVGLIRGTTADRRGNITMEREGLIGEVLPIAQAAKNCGGIVIVQVEEIVDEITDPKAVRVPGILVDHVVVAGRESAQHPQTFGETYNPAYVSGLSEKENVSSPGPLAFSERKIIGCRALCEIPEGAVVNLGIGLPEAVAAVAAETGRLDDFTLTVESGPIGGVPASGLSFGCAWHPEAIIDQPSQFDYYDGGGLDVAILGAIEIDAAGNVNISQFGNRFAGVGGFVNITQNAKQVVFCCPFRAGGLEVGFENGELNIKQEGKHQKFVEQVVQIAFNGKAALQRGQEVIYITERAVFQLTDDGLALIETAPGIDLQTDILDKMNFAPTVSSSLAIMPDDLFS